MLIGQSQQNLISQIIWVDTHSLESTVSSVSSLDNDVLTWGNIKADDTLVVVQNV